MTVRLVATNSLHQILTQKKTITHVLGREEIASLSESEKRYLQELLYGVCRHYARLAFFLDTLLEKPLKSTDHHLRYLLLLAMYELLYCRTAEYAVVNETVKTCRHLKKAWAKSLVNALLRRLLREKEQLCQAANHDLLAKTNHPLWMIERLQQAWPKEWESIIDTNNSKPPMSLRVNLQKNSRKAYLNKLETSGHAASIHPFNETGITLAQPCEVNALPDFATGAVSVQDNAAQLAVPLLQLKKGFRVLDACAAPGGKTLHCLEHTPDLTELVALDRDSRRLSQLTDNLRRTKQTVTLQCADVCNVEEWWDGRPFDRILCDAPCSATGVIRRHPEIKWLRTPKQIDTNTQDQLHILKALWPTLAEKGRLLYVTCSIFPQENDEVLKEFLSTTPNATCQTIHAPWGQRTQYGRQILPGEANMDGFYFALLVNGNL